MHFEEQNFECRIGNFRERIWIDERKGLMDSTYQNERTQPKELKLPNACLVGVGFWNSLSDVGERVLLRERAKKKEGDF
jgi:hypothetical protein